MQILGSAPARRIQSLWALQVKPFNCSFSLTGVQGSSGLRSLTLNIFHHSLQGGFNTPTHHLGVGVEEELSFGATSPSPSPSFPRLLAPRSRI